MWQYQGIGTGKECQFSGKMPEASPAMQRIPFTHEYCGEGNVTAAKQTATESIPCPKELCIKVFKNMERLQKHLETGTCQFEDMNPPTLKKIRDMWQKRYREGDHIMVDIETKRLEEDGEVHHNPLQMGWAIPERTRRVLNERFV